MRTVKIVTLIVAGTALAFGIALFALTRYLDSAAFRQAVVGAAREALGADVQIGEMRVSLLSGVTLRQVSVSHPSGVPGDLLRAEALVVRPRLLPLLRRRLEIDEMRLDGPVVTLRKTASGAWSHELAGARPPGAPPPPTSPARPDAPIPVPPVSGLDVNAPRLGLTRGTVEVFTEPDRAVLRLSGIELATSLSRLGGTIAGDGRLDVARIRIAERVDVEALAAPLRFKGTDLILDPIQARLANGTLAGKITVGLGGGARYTLALDLADARAEVLLAAMGSKTLTGRLRGQLRVEGSAAGATGTGHVEIRDGQLLDFPVLGAVATALDLPLLRELRFEEGAIDLVLAGDVLRTPSIRFVARDVRITGQGEVALRTGMLDHQLTLLVPAEVVRRAPRDMRSAFTERPGGLMGVDFRVWGPYRAPRTDLQDRVLRGFAESLLKKGLKQLFR